MKCIKSCLLTISMFLIFHFSNLSLRFVASLSLHFSEVKHYKINVRIEYVKETCNEDHRTYNATYIMLHVLKYVLY